MTLVLIEVPNESAVEALAEQQNLRVVRIIPEGEGDVILTLKRPAATVKEPAPAPRKWAGALAAISTTSAEEWDKHLHDIRNEWERDI